MTAAAPPVIQKLDQDVVNRIAAGEVIQRPSNALKEMLENSLDAGSTSITVSVKGGGLKMLQISDNGHGIRKEDLGIVCERFTTSKLREFSDLRSISTFGFRGEALASISHVSHLTICSRTRDSECAFKGSYVDGRIKESARPTAGSVGTQITVEDLFYNVPTRRKALNNLTDEHQRIADVVSKYSIHNAGVAFTLRKAGEGGPSGGISVRTQQGSSILDNIGVIFGSQTAKDVMHVQHESASLGYKLSGFISNANCSKKKFIFLLFINHRLVDCPSLKRGLTNVYQAFLPKGSHPFVYMSLEIAPGNIDVNVHPTKHEVHFLNEEEIIESIQRAVEVNLRNCDSSRTFYTQALLPNMSVNFSQKPTEKLRNLAETRIYAHETVRTDSKLQKLDAFFKPGANSVASTVDNARKSCEAPENDFTGMECCEIATEGDKNNEQKVEVGNNPNRESTRTVVDDEPNVEFSNKNLDFSRHSRTASVSSSSITDKIVEPASKKPRTGESPPGTVEGKSAGASNSKKLGVTTSSFPKRRQIQLTSVLELQQEVKDNSQEDLVKLLGDHSWVGCIDPELALIQHGTKLFMTNTTILSEELFYQIMVFDFGNFGIYRLSEPAPTFDLVMLALESEESGWKPADGNKAQLAKHVVEFIHGKSEMLSDYFSFEMNENGDIVGLPMLLPDYEPSLDGLPMFLLRLSTEVDWESEIECFRTFCREYAKFYSVRKGYIDMPELLEMAEKTGVNSSYANESFDSCATSNAVQTNPSWKWVIEHIIYRAFQKILLPNKSMLDDGTFLQLASLPDLYKVFERC